MSKEAEYTFEDAILQTKFGKFNYFLIAISGLMLACGFIEASGISLIFPITQCELNLNNFDKGLLGSASYVGIILSSHFWGFMADTSGRKAVIVPALFLSFMFTVISSFAKSFWFLLIFRFLNGFCICAPQSITYAYLGEFHSLKNRARVLLVASVLYGIFCLITPLNGFLYINRDDWTIFIPYLNINYGTWRLFLLMSGVPSIISAIGLIAFIPESPKFTYAQGNEAETLRILQRIFKYNTGKSAGEYEVKSLVKDEEFVRGLEGHSKGFFNFMWSQTVPLFKHPHLKNTLTACYLYFGICVSSNGFYTFLPEILNKVSMWQDNNASNPATICEIFEAFDKNQNATVETEECITKIELSTFTSLAMLIALFCTLWLVMSLIINKTGKLAIIATVLFSGGISSILIMFVKILPLSIALYFVIQIASVNMSVVNSSTVELFPTNLRAMAVSISMMTGRVGSAFGSNFVGLLIKDYCTYTWLLPATLSITGGILAFTIPNINKIIK